MALKDYQPERLEVTSKKLTFSVRGLSLNDLTVILRGHGEDLERLIALYNSIADMGGSRSDVSGRMVSTMLTDVPLLAARVIAQATDEDGIELDNVVRIPMPLQIDALQKIMKLTFEEVGGVKKFGAVLLKTLNDMGFSVVPASITAKVLSKMNLGTSRSMSVSEPT
jgi:hypothetical protein